MISVTFLFFLKGGAKFSATNSLVIGVSLLIWNCSFGEPAKTLISPFGIGSSHVNNRSVNDYQRWIPEMSKIGIRVYRSPRVSWGALETEKGGWDWKNLDQQMSYLEKQNIKTGALLIGNPGWNESDPPGSLPVNNLAAWSNYVETVVTHLKGRVKRYEIWNEPPNFTGKDQTPADYAKIVMAAYRAAKKSGPGLPRGACRQERSHQLSRTNHSGRSEGPF